LKAEYPEICFVDTHPHLDGEHEKFIDAIHLTGDGNRQLAENVFAGIRGVLVKDVGASETRQRPAAGRPVEIILP